MDVKEYGEIFSKSEVGDKTVYTVINESCVSLIESTGSVNKVKIPKPIDLEWVDTSFGGVFKRQIGKNTIWIDTKEEKVLVKEKQLSAKPFREIKEDKNIITNNSFMTIDIETVLMDNVQIPYLICGYGNGIQIESYAKNLSEEGQAEMFNDFISNLLALKKKK